MSAVVQELIETIRHGTETLAIIVRAAHQPENTRFVTSSGFGQQVGFIVYPAGGSIPAHRHKTVERRVRGTGEVLLVRSGCCEVDFFDDVGVRVAERELQTGDVLILVAGGHGFRMLEATVLLEIKQGPYLGDGEKEYL